MLQTICAPHTYVVYVVYVVYVAYVVYVVYVGYVGCVGQYGYDYGYCYDYDYGYGYVKSVDSMDNVNSMRSAGPIVNSMDNVDNSALFIPGGSELPRCCQHCPCC